MASGDEVEEAHEAMLVVVYKIGHSIKGLRKIRRPQRTRIVRVLPAQLQSNVCKRRPR